MFTPFLFRSFFIFFYSFADALDKLGDFFTPEKKD